MLTHDLKTFWVYNWYDTPKQKLQLVMVGKGPKLASSAAYFITFWLLGMKIFIASWQPEIAVSLQNDHFLRKLTFPEDKIIQVCDAIIRSRIISWTLAAIEEEGFTAMWGIC